MRLRQCAGVGRPDIVNRTLGFAGSVAIAVGGLAAGALPQRDPFAHWPLIRELRAFPLVGVAGTYFGLALLCGAWLRMRSTVDGQRPADLVRTLLCWAAPLALTAPMFSRDVYSYLAQGEMVRRGLDAYRWGPSSLGGPLALDVPAIWQDTPAPYGPVFLRCASAILTVTGEHTVLGVWAMRLVALTGVALAVACLPGLAARFGVPAQRALWFGALNPLLLLHLVAGAHNDALMVGLLAAGLLAAVRDRPLLAAALVVAAALVKAPAILALITVVALSRGRAPALIRTAAGAGLAFVVLQAASGTRPGLDRRAAHPDNRPQRPVRQHRHRHAADPGRPPRTRWRSSGSPRRRWAAARRLGAAARPETRRRSRPRPRRDRAVRPGGASLVPAVADHPARRRPAPPPAGGGPPDGRRRHVPAAVRRPRLP